MPEILTVGAAPDAALSMIKAAPPARSTAEMAEVVVLFSSNVPAATSMLKFALVALVVRSLSSRVPAPVFLRMPASRAPYWATPVATPLSVEAMVSTPVLFVTSRVLGAFTVMPRSVIVVGPEEAVLVYWSVPPLRRMLPTAAVACPSGPASTPMFTLLTLTVPLLMMSAPEKVLLPASTTRPLPTPELATVVTCVVPTKLSAMTELTITSLLELFRKTKSPEVVVPVLAPAMR